MTATNLRFYAFVSRFVDAVSHEALSTELHRSRQARLRFEMAQRPAAEASGTVALPVPDRRAA